MMGWRRDGIDWISDLLPRTRHVFWWTDHNGDRYGHDLFRGDTKILGSAEDADIRIDRLGIRPHHIELRCTEFGRRIQISPREAIHSVRVRNWPADHIEALPRHATFSLGLITCSIEPPPPFANRDEHGRYHESDLEVGGSWVGLAQPFDHLPSLSLMDVLGLCEDGSRSFIATSDSLSKTHKVILVVHEGRIRDLCFRDLDPYEVLEHLLRGQTLWSMDDSSLHWHGQARLDATPQQLFEAFHRRHGGS